MLPEATDRLQAFRKLSIARRRRRGSLPGVLSAISIRKPACHKKALQAAGTKCRAGPGLQRFSQKRCLRSGHCPGPGPGCSYPRSRPLPICNFALPEHVTAITENGFLRDQGPARTGQYCEADRIEEHGRNRRASGQGAAVRDQRGAKLRICFASRVRERLLRCPLSHALRTHVRHRATSHLSRYATSPEPSGYYPSQIKQSARQRTGHQRFTSDDVEPERISIKQTHELGEGFALAVNLDIADAIASSTVSSLS